MATLTDTARLAQTLREVRFAAFPDGHLPPPVADPTPSEQVADWERLQHRLLHLLPGMVRQLLLSPDEREHLPRLREVLAPLCSPEAAGPNSHLALMLYERILLVLEPGLAASEAAAASA